MPRKRQPPTLRASSLRALAAFVLDWCEKSEDGRQVEIQQCVQEIPDMFANDYVEQVLQLCSSGRYYLDITSAFHPKCTEITEKKKREFSDWGDQILRGLHVMSDLISIEPVISPFPQMRRNRHFRFPKMGNLRSITVFITNPGHLRQVVENCPRLEDIEICYETFTSCYFEMPSTFVLLSNCKHLKKICVPDMTPEVAIHLLDHLPNLEVLRMSSGCIRRVLPLCESAYQLNDIVAFRSGIETASLQQVVTHFPHLEGLTLMIDGNVHVNAIRELANLKRLTLLYCGTASNLLFLMDVCMFGLQQLHLRSATGLDSLFKQNMTVSYPNLKSLTIQYCTGINVAGIREIFPNLKCLELLYGDYVGHSLPCKMPHAGSQALEELNITHVPVPQVRYLIPFCSELNMLEVNNYYKSVKSSVYEILCNTNLKELRTLKVRDHDMKEDVIPIILDSCGEYLERVELHGDELILSPDHVLELSHQLQWYDVDFSVNGSKM